MKKTFNSIFLLFFTFVSVNTFADSCTAIANGNWENPAIWSCGHVPLAGDSVYISSGDTVTITTPNLTYNDTLYIEIDGKLEFDGGKLILVDGSQIVINTGGIIGAAPPANGNNDKIRIGGNTVWTTNQGDLPGPLILNSGGVSLYISFINFDVDADDNIITINWSVRESGKSSNYIIEKSHYQNEFDQLTIVSAPYKYENEISYYRFSYKENEFENLYFRIKGQDEAGSCYSKLIKINNLIENLFSIYPNPSQGFINIEVNSLESVVFKVFDGRGIEVKSQMLTKNINSISLNLPPGIYIAVLNMSSTLISTRLIVK